MNENESFSILGGLIPSEIYENIEEIQEIDLLMEHYKYLQSIKLSGYQIKKTQTQQSALLSNSLFADIKLARQVSLLYLSQMDDFEFFDCPNYIEMYDCAKQEPAQIGRRYQNLVSESLKNVINEIHHDHKYFMEHIIKYFSNDIMNITIFSYSTFPALYGFFVTDGFCEFASNFLIDVISRSSKEILSVHMVTSFFLCSYKFIEGLWSYFYDRVMLGMNQNAILKLMVESIDKSSHLLSIHHIHLIRKYYKIDSSECIKFLLNNFLRTSFDIWFLNGKYLLPKLLIDSIHEMFDSLLSPTILAAGKKIYKAFRNGRKSPINGIPRTPSHYELDSIPIILSDRDVCVLIEILQDSQNLSKPLKQLANNLSAIEKNSYAPFMLGFFPKIHLNKDDSFANIEVKIKRTWAAIKQKSFENSAFDPIAYYLKKVTKVNSDLLRYALQFEIVNHYERYKRADTVLSTRLLVPEYRTVGKAIVPCYFNLLYNHALKLTNNVNGGEFKSKRIGGKILKSLQIHRSSGDFRPELAQYIFAAILDKYVMKPDRNLVAMRKLYENLLNDEMKKISAEVLKYRRVTELLIPHIKNVKSAMEWPLGHQFFVFMELASIINQMDKNYTKKKHRSFFPLMFENAMIIINDPLVFDSFLLFKKMISQMHDEYFIHFSKETQDNWTLFLNGMDRILSIDRHVKACCAKYRFKKLHSRMSH